MLLFGATVVAIIVIGVGILEQMYIVGGAGIYVVFSLPKQKKNKK